MREPKSLTGTVRMVAREVLNAPDTDAIAFELRCLWDDLETGRRLAANGVWSIGCEHTVIRIANLMMHTNTAVPPSHVPPALVIDGIYQAIHEAIQIPTPKENQK